MAPQISIHAVFDTNGLYTASAHVFLPRNVSEVINASAKSSLSVHWYVPPIVALEREYQMLEEAKEFLPSLKKADRLFETSSAVTLEAAHARVKQLIAESIKSHGIIIPKFDAHAVDLVRIVEHAVFRLPPFEGGDKEKGFRDAIVLETFCQLHETLNLAVPNQLVLITSDRLLTEAVTERLRNSPVLVIYKNMEALETSLVAFATELDQNEARELVGTARTFFNQNMTVQRLHQIIFERYGDSLRRSSVGESLSSWQVIVGDTALIAKQATKVTFQTGVLVYSQATRPIYGIPVVQVTGIVPNSPLTALSTGATSSTSTMTVTGDAPGAGTAFGTISSVLPSTISVSTTGASTGSIQPSSVAVSTATGTTGGISVLTNVGRHALKVRWSARLSDHKLNDFELIDVEYEGVVWQ